jgi:hypothetical protein
MKNLKFLWFLFSIAFLTWSCEEKFEEPNNPLTANAGEEQEITTGVMAVLDGSKSTNAAGKPMMYSWELLEKPAGAIPTLSYLNSVAVQFTTDTEGAYTFELTVSYNAWTDKAEVTIVVSEGDEILLEARGGDDQSQNLGNMIQLDGTLSLNETGVDLSFLWEFVSKPEGSAVQFSSANTGVTNFQPDKPGEYLVKLTIKAGTSQSSDLIKITVLDGANGDGPVILNSDILSDRTLPDVFVNNPEKLDYLVTKDIAVKGAKLTVEPGVRIGFEEGTGFTIDANGSLRVYTMDLTNKPVIFQGKEAIKGYWDGINISSTQAPDYIVGLEVRDAGKLGYGIKYTNGAKAHLNRATVHHNSGVGIWFDDTFSLEEFKYNHLYDNDVSPLKIPARLISDLFIENQILDKNIQVTEGKILSGLEHIWPIFPVGYDVMTDLVIYNGSSLILSEGTKIDMNDDKAIRVINGSILKILGSPHKPVIIEGMKKASGAWRGIYIDNSRNGPSSIFYAEIRHAGSNAIAGQTPATIKLGNGAKFKLYKTVLDQGKGDGFEAVGSNIGLAFEENKIMNHTGHPS